MDILNLIENNSTNNYKNIVFGINNSKLKKNNIASFDLPQGITCPFAGECLKFCYAKKGSYHYPNVKKKYTKNYELSISDNFINIVDESIKALPNVNFYRIHSSGDYYNRKYINKWVQIAKNNPTKVFYSYTKSMQLFKNINLPQNFIINQSEGTKNDNKYIDYKKTFVRIFENKNELITAVESGNFIDCSNNDLESVKANILNKNIALLKH